MRNIFAFFFFSIFFFPVYSQTDTEFWFAVPKLHEGPNRSEYIKLCFVSYDHPATITITQPANPLFNGGQPIVVTLESANDFEAVDLYNYRTGIETTPVNTALDRGLRIQSDYPITAYYAITKQNSEIYTLKGHNALGTKFIVPMQKTYKAGENGKSSVEIVASQNDTKLLITPANDCEGGLKKGVPVEVILQKGQSYAIRAQGQTGALNLGGTLVESLNGKPVAVNSTDDFLVIGSDKDLAGDQIVPINLVGYEYVALRNDYGNAEEVCIYPVEEGVTQVNIGGQVFAVEYGKPKTYVLTASATYIRSEDEERHIVVYQLSSRGNELGGTMLPNISCTGSSSVAYDPAFSAMKQAKVGLLVRSENLDGMFGSYVEEELNLFQDVPNTSGAWKYYYEELRGGVSGPIQIKNSKGLFHMSVSDTGSGTSTYGYFSDYNVMSLSATAGSYYYTEGDNIQLSVGNSDNLKSVEWIFPDGTVYANSDVPVKHPLIENALESNSGMYVVRGEHKTECPIDNDTIFITVFNKKATEEETYYSCRGVEFELTAPGYGPYTWNTGKSEGDVKTVTVVPMNDLSSYSVKNFHAGENMLPADERDEFCFQEDNTVLYQGTIPGYVQMDNMRYVLTCLARMSNPTDANALRFNINGSLFTPEITEGGTVWQKLTFIWNADERKVNMSVVADPANIAAGEVCVTNITFSPLYEITDNFYAMISDSLSPRIVADSEYLCSAEMGVTLSVEETYDTYSWSTGETMPTISVHAAGTYSCRVGTNDTSCRGTTSYELKPTPEVAIAMETQLQVCPGESNLGIHYIPVSGELTRYEVHFGEKALAAGFINSSGSLSVGEPISLTVPKTISPDVYEVVLEVFESVCNVSYELPFEITVRYPVEQVLVQRWNEVLGVMNVDYNGGISFKTFQWYKNGTAMEDQNEPNLYVLDGFNGDDCYSVLLTREDGVAIQSCDTCPDILSSVPVANPFSQLVFPGEFITLVESKDGTAVFFQLTGTVESVQSFYKGECTIQAPEKSGIYILSLSKENHTSQYKIIVR